jgi:predicted MFS family arabinose efflux permease
MKTTAKLPFITLLLMISFASVNAVLFTPSLPNIATYFVISDNAAQQMITWFLIGYALSQLIYGPLANRFGRKSALYAGIFLQVASSLVCIAAGYMHEYSLLVLGRFFLAIGSGVGLKMTFTLVNESYDVKVASQKISYLMLAFAFTPGLGVALGGILNAHFGWMSCFYACAVYGLVLFICVTQLSETQHKMNIDALKLSHIISAYHQQFKNVQLLAGGLLMGSCTSFIYVFAAISPFIAINLFGMTSAEYGMANMLPPIGILLGSLASAKLVNRYTLPIVMRAGISITIVGVMVMLMSLLVKMPILISLFISTIIIYFGLCLILANASSIAMGSSEDKSHAAAVMSFINMSTATIVVLSMGLLTLNSIMLPIVYLTLSVMMMSAYKWLCRLG